MDEKTMYNGIEIDVALAQSIKNEILLEERVNARTNELSNEKMIARDLKILEDRVDAY